MDYKLKKNHLAISYDNIMGYEVAETINLIKFCIMFNQSDILTKEVMADVLDILSITSYGILYVYGNISLRGGQRTDVEPYVVLKARLFRCFHDLPTYIYLSSYRNLFNS